MTIFNSITQYDKFFADQTKGKFAGINFCPFFSLLTALEYVKNTSYSQKTHNEVVIKSVLNHVALGVSQPLSFNSLVSITNIDSNNIQGTTVELIKENIISYQHIFENKNKPYCVIFLKNGKFFVVLVTADYKFHVRDCHEKNQINDLSFEEIQKYLNETYQFNKEIDLDGYKIEEFSNIEYIQISEPFETKVSPQIDHPLLTEWKQSESQKVTNTNNTNIANKANKPNKQAEEAEAEAEAEAETYNIMFSGNDANQFVLNQRNFAKAKPTSNTSYVDFD